MKFETEIISCTPKDDYYLVVLKETQFYPLSGGQLSDIGTINSAKISHVYSDNNVTYHISDTSISGKASCQIDAKARHNHSLLHSSQHLLSAIFDIDKIESSSFTMKEDHFTIELSAHLSREQFDDYEHKINHHIRKNIPIICREYDANTDSNVDISHLENHDKIRVVEIVGLEVNACGGTHLTSTGQIGYLKIAKTKKVKENTKIIVYVGEYAINLMQSFYNQLNNAANIMTTNYDKVCDAINNKFDENKSLKKEIKELKKNTQ